MNPEATNDLVPLKGDSSIALWRSTGPMDQTLVSAWYSWQLWSFYRDTLFVAISAWRSRSTSCSPTVPSNANDLPPSLNSVQPRSASVNPAKRGSILLEIG